MYIIITFINHYTGNTQGTNAWWIAYTNFLLEHKKAVIIMLKKQCLMLLVNSAIFINESLLDEIIVNNI